MGEWAIWNVVYNLGSLIGSLFDSQGQIPCPKDQGDGNSVEGIKLYELKLSH